MAKSADGMPMHHPSEERAAAALEAAGLNPYLLMGSRAVAPTDYPEVGLTAGRNRFLLLSVEDVPVPRLPRARRDDLHRLALHLAERWGLLWRGAIEEGRVQVAFGGEVPYGPEDDPDEAGLRLHDAILALHHAHQSFRRRALNAAWRAPPVDVAPQAVA